MNAINKKELDMLDNGGHESDNYEKLIDSIMKSNLSNLNDCLEMKIDLF